MAPTLRASIDTFMGPTPNDFTQTGSGELLARDTHAKLM